MKKLPMFREAVPEWLRFPLLLLLPFIYQCSNPLYMNIAAEVVSDRGQWTPTDVMMCGFACILGITVTFPLLFRLKFRFTTRQIILTCSAAIVLLTLAAEYIQLLPLAVLVCFLFGIFKVWGTFECMSSMMQIISPNMHLAPFLTVVFLAVFGGVELGGLASTAIAHYYTWHHVSYALIATHLVVILFAILLLRDFRFQPPAPLKGIDWGGFLLWSLFLLPLTAVFVYADTLEWPHSTPLVICLLVSIVALVANLYRMHTHPAPFIALQCFRYRNLWPIMLLFFISGVMLSSQTVLQNVFTSSILGYPPIVSVRLNWAILAGVVVGCFLGKWGLTGLGWNYKQLTFLSLLFTTMYAAAMYFLVNPISPLSAMVLPCIFSGIGHALIFVVLTTYVESNTPFEHRFMMLTVLGLVRTGVASPIGAHLYSRLLRVQLGYNIALLSTPTAAPEAVVGGALMVGVRNLFGITVMIGLLAMLILLGSRFADKRYITLPTLRKIRSLLPQ